MSLGQICGWSTTILFAACYMPQLWKTFKTKSVGDVSFGQWIIQQVGYGTGIYFACSLQEPILIVGYTWGFICTLLYLIMHARYHKG